VATIAWVIRLPVIRATFWRHCAESATLSSHLKSIGI